MQFPYKEFCAKRMKNWVVITGAGSGIGAGVAKLFANKGFHILAIGRRPEPLRRLQEEAPKDYIHVLSGDIAKEETIFKIRDSLPTSDCLCYVLQNAAVAEPALLSDIDLKHFNYAMAVNVSAPLHITQVLLPQLRAGKGRILHVGTGIAFEPQIGTTTYGVTKMAFHRLFQQLRVELDGTGVHISSISPGMIDTEGLWEHCELAKRLDLPHAAYFDMAKKEGSMRAVDVAARFISFVLQDTSDEEFSANEWKLNDRSHWNRWEMS